MQETDRCNFLDFSKAFDAVPHDKLLLKLKSILKNNITDWIANYLRGRSQFVHVNGVNSYPTPILSGVPQGSVLGPLLLSFIVFINDITCNIPVNVRLFADDIVLYTEISSAEDQQLLNSFLAKVNDWTKASQMTHNPLKCIYINIMRKKTTCYYVLLPSR